MSDNEIQKAAEELFKDSEYPVPNIYCFTEGAKWALSHQWVKVGAAWNHHTHLYELNAR